MKLSDAEWIVMEVLWTKEFMMLGEIVEHLQSQTKWSRTTVHTYLTRMEKKGLVYINRDVDPHLYSAKKSKEDCSKQERQNLLNKVYQGSVSDLVVAFLKESKISSQEKERLSKLIDEMEV